MRSLIVCLVLASALPALAENHALKGDRERRTYRLAAGDTLNVTGNRCDVRVEGSSGTVNVLGNHNTILVDGAIQQVNLNGSHNEATVIITNGRPGTEVVQAGRYNSVMHKPR